MWGGGSIHEEEGDDKTRYPQSIGGSALRENCHSFPSQLASKVSARGPKAVQRGKESPSSFISGKTEWEGAFSRPHNSSWVGVLPRPGGL